MKAFQKLDRSLNISGQRKLTLFLIFAITLLLLAAPLSIGATDDAAAAPGQAFRADRGQAPGADLWVMGIEVNQGFSDRVFTELERGPGQAGFVSGRQSAAVPFYAGKPAVVRVYVGLRARAGTPAEGVMATGRLLVTKDGAETAFQPLENPGCSDHLGRAGPQAGQSCSAAIRVYPSLGRQGLNTRSSYDLDLIDRRSHWQGTLNFVLPAEYTRDLRSGLVLQAEVEPTYTREADPRDNTFRLDLARVVPPQVLPLRLVRIRTGSPEPTRAQAERAISDMLQLTSFSRAEIISDDVMVYDSAGTASSAALSAISGLIDGRELTKTESMWLELAETFKPRTDSVLFALTPAGFETDGEAGLGWRVPDNSSGFSGGIALTIMPPYAGRETEDWEWAAILAHELYHAWLDVRHVSSGLGEENGCFFAGKQSLLAKIFNLLAVDSDCARPSTHQNGAIGTYPESESQGGPLLGDRGGVGVRIMPDSPNWRLVLYDPCPTGPVVRESKRVSLSFQSIRPLAPEAPSDSRFEFTAGGQSLHVQLEGFSPGTEVALPASSTIAIDGLTSWDRISLYLAAYDEAGRAIAGADVVFNCESGCTPGIYRSTLRQSGLERSEPSGRPRGRTLSQGLFEIEYTISEENSLEADPLKTISQRYPACTLDNSLVPHDFMSYGTPRWTSGEQFFRTPGQ